MKAQAAADTKNGLGYFSILSYIALKSRLKANFLLPKSFTC